MKKLLLSGVAALFIIGCGGGGGGSNTTVTDSNEFDFLSTDGVSGKILFKKSNPTSSLVEEYTIKSIDAHMCEVEPISPVTLTVDKNNPTAEFEFNAAFKKAPCYTDQIYINYEKKILDGKEEKQLSVLNPQYDQSKVYKMQGDDPLYQYQWHLKNTGQDFGIVPATAGEDINVEPVWKENITGKGVVIGVIDSGVDMFHPDLKENIDWKDSYNYLTGTQNVTPLGDKPYTAETDQYLFAHGTAVAGIIAAKGWNGIGTRGVAPDAKIAAFNPLVSLVGEESEDGYTSDTIPSIQTVRMLDSLVRNLDNIDIYNNSWGGDATTLIDDLLMQEQIDYDTQSNYGVKFGRNQKGVIYIKSAGNEGNESNVNFEQLQTNGNWIVVGAVGADGTITSYSTPGSAILISAPGGGSDPDYTKQNKLEIVTTDLAGDKRGFDREDVYATLQPHFNVKGNENYDYTYFMNGTSAAAPVVSGVVALMLEANPNLTYRDIQIILAKTARQNDINDSEWQTNNAGLHFNYKYGFGVVDAKKAVEMAKTFKSVGNYKDVKTASAILNVDKNSTNGELNVSVPINENITVENAKLYITIDNNQSKNYYSGPDTNLSLHHTSSTNNIMISLISPSGTKSVLVKAPNSLTDQDVYLNTRLLSTNFMEEKSEGNWTVNIKSVNNGEFNLKNIKLEITGH